MMANLGALVPTEQPEQVHYRRNVVQHFRRRRSLPLADPDRIHAHAVSPDHRQKPYREDDRGEDARGSAIGIFEKRIVTRYAQDHDLAAPGLQETVARRHLILDHRVVAAVENPSSAEIRRRKPFFYGEASDLHSAHLPRSSTRTGTASARPVLTSCFPGVPLHNGSPGHLGAEMTNRRRPDREGCSPCHDNTQT